MGFLLLMPHDFFAASLISRIKDKLVGVQPNSPKIKNDKKMESTSSAISEVSKDGSLKKDHNKELEDLYIFMLENEKIDGIFKIIYQNKRLGNIKKNNFNFLGDTELNSILNELEKNNNFLKNDYKKYFFNIEFLKFLLFSSDYNIWKLFIINNLLINSIEMNKKSGKNNSYIELFLFHFKEYLRLEGNSKYYLNANFFNKFSVLLKKNSLGIVFEMEQLKILKLINEYIGNLKNKESISNEDKKKIATFIIKMNNYFKEEVFLIEKFEGEKIIKKHKKENGEFLKIYDFISRLSLKYHVKNRDNFNFFEGIKYFASCVNQLSMVIVYILKLHKDVTIDPLFEKIKKSYEYNPQQNPFLLGSWVFQVSFLEKAWEYNKIDILSKNMKIINHLMQAVNDNLENIPDEEKSKIREWIKKNKNQFLNYFLSEKFITLLPKFNEEQKILIQEIIEIMDKLLFNLPLLKILKIYKFSNKSFVQSVEDTIKKINALTTKTLILVSKTNNAIDVVTTTGIAATSALKLAEETTKKVNYMISPDKWNWRLINPINWLKGNKKTDK